VKTCKALLAKYDYDTKMKYYLKNFDSANEVRFIILRLAHCRIIT
jgi:hypothetical protein